MDDLREQIKLLERRSQALEPDEAARDSMLADLTRFTRRFLEDVRPAPSYIETPDQGAGLLDSPIGEQPIGMEEALRLLQEHVFTPGVNIGSAGTLAYIPPSTLYAAALGDFLAAVTNRYLGMYFAAPGAVRMERMLLRWMADFIGYPETSAGDLTSGGSIANLMGIVTARDAFGLAGA
ncbi:MAG: pyridoxal-dependent decarboxylase, partial [Anaerolineales bacterium]